MVQPIIKTYIVQDIRAAWWSKAHTIITTFPSRVQPGTFVVCLSCQIPCSISAVNYISQLLNKKTKIPKEKIILRKKEQIVHWPQQMTSAAAGIILEALFYIVSLNKTL